MKNKESINCFNKNIKRVNNDSNYNHDNDNDYGKDNYQYNKKDNEYDN